MTRRIVLLSVLIAVLTIGGAIFAAGCSRNAPPAPGLETPPEASSGSPSGVVGIPGGSFLMGCSPDDKECDYNEKPAHQVTVKHFSMDVTQVTQAQFKAVMGKNPSKFQPCPTCPVDAISWSDAHDYCAKVGKRLPTEAEWEFAARGGTAGARYADVDSIAWYANNADEKTHPVATKKPNDYGLYDMLGNVLEWCADWYDGEYYAKAPSDNPQGPAAGGTHVLRGGSWVDPAKNVRASTRGWFSPTSRYFVFTAGFRCARDEK
jgi:formylglycine-generating enzyme required for sulfatase activity